MFYLNSSISFGECLTNLSLLAKSSANTVADVCLLGVVSFFSFFALCE